jgi:hypothetical protein
VKAYADLPVAAQVTPVGFPWLHTLPPVHDDLDGPLGFLRSKVLAQKGQQLWLIAAHDIEHTGRGLSLRDIARARSPRFEDLVGGSTRCPTV